MPARSLFPLVGALLMSGCLYHVREQADEAAAALSLHAIDRAPDVVATRPASPNRPDPGPVETKELSSDVDVMTTSFLQAKEGSSVKDILPSRLNIPERIPGSEAGLIKLPADKEQKAAEVRRLFPPLADLPDYPKGEPGPDGRPYALTDLHRLATLNSATVRQAVADVATARGNFIQARMYPNPTVGYQLDPNNNNSSGSTQGVFVDQLIKVGGKLKIQTAASYKDLENAELALKRARSDLATQVRNAYFTFLVAREAVEVTRALAQFTDDVYRLQANLLTTGLFMAAYEPAPLRAQANLARLAHRQAIESYVYNWKQVAAVVGVRDLPLSQVSGQVDRFLPQFDYNAALAHVLRNHTDVLTARNTIDKQNYNLKAAQVTPVPDVDVRWVVSKETTLPPFTWFATLQLGMQIPIWDQNRGNILAAEGTLARALQEPRRVENDLANRLAAAFAVYRTNVDALEAYRRDILPDQVRAYRGVYERRRIDVNSPFGDLVTAQGAVAASVTAYLTTLGQTWNAAVALADFLQTDDLFQMGTPTPLTPVPRLDLLPAPTPVAPPAMAQIRLVPGRVEQPAAGTTRAAGSPLGQKALATGSR